MAAQALLRKLSEFVDRHHGYNMVPESAWYLRDSMEVPSELDSEPGHVMRLTKIIEVVDGRHFDLVPAHRREAYIYALLPVALSAYDGELFEKVPDFAAALVRPDLTAATHFCVCEECEGNRTLMQHVEEAQVVPLAHTDATLIQLAMDGVHMLPMERIRLRLPRTVIRERRNVWLNPWEVVMPQPQHPRAEDSSDSEEEFSEEEEEEEGVYSSDEGY
ncbi:hypothetical protein Aduo_002579 [Ancylostoma duodenale]